MAGVFLNGKIFWKMAAVEHTIWGKEGTALVSGVNKIIPYC